MKVLVACEFSGIVREAFKRRGHDAWSCDLRSSEIEGQHLQCNVLSILGDGWDLMVGHPPCTHLSVSGARWCVDHWVKRKKGGNWWHDGAEKRRLRKEALEFFHALLSAPIDKICLEQPMSVATRVKAKTQTIQPWQFGHGEQKTTWLWLKGLPKLSPTNIVDGREQRIWKMTPGPERERGAAPIQAWRKQWQSNGDDSEIPVIQLPASSVQ